MLNLRDRLCDIIIHLINLTNPPAQPLREIDIPINASSLPVAYTTIDRNFSNRLTHQGTALSQSEYCQISQTGFAASFYQDGQLANFTYFIDGSCGGCPQLSLAQGKESGRYEHFCEGVFWGETYYNGEVSDENPWSDGIPPRKEDFLEWIRENIRIIVRYGFRHQLELGKSKEQAIIDLGIQDLSIFDNF